MSPFTQLNAAIGFGSGRNRIDREFSPIFSYLDEFDRHFSHRHRFMNCFIPRFDLEEDAVNYYLFGDVPGAKVEDITIEAQDNHTLVIYGATKRDIVPSSIPEAKSENGFVKVDGKNEPILTPTTKQAELDVYGEGNGGELQPNTNLDKSLSSSPANHHLRHITNSIQHDHYTGYTAQNSFPSHDNNDINNNNNDAAAPNNGVANNRILLSERLVGEFHRTFAFPSEVNEEGVQASMEDGVLRVVVPKRGARREEKRGRKVPIFRKGM